MTTNPSTAPAWMLRVAPFAAVLIGLVFCFSAFTKFLNPRAFVTVMGDYGVFRPELILPLATGAVALEFALGLMLITGIGRRVAARIALPLVVAFILLMIRAIATGMTGCGCFGDVIEIPPRLELVVDVVLLAGLFVVLRAGQNFSPSHGLGWVALCVGAVIFLARGPVVAGEGTLDLEFDDLAVLATAQPPLGIPRDGFIFFFAADCDHCWAYAGGVEMMARRIRDFRVVGVTMSDPAAVEGFREAFQPSYPIHVLPPGTFNALVDNYPSGVWLQDGVVARTWSGFIPGLRQIVEEGGYQYAPPAVEYGTPREETDNPFGGPLRVRQ